MPMRYVRWSVCVLVVSGCIPIPIIHIQSRTEVTTKRVRSGFVALQKSIRAGRASLPTARCGAETCYATRDVEAYFASILDAVAEIVPDAATPLRLGLQDAIRQEIASMGRTVQPAILPVQYSDSVSVSPYSTRIVDAVVDRILAIVERVLSYDELALTLDVTSNPNGAQFAIQVANDATSLHTTRTNNKLPAVWRGVYSGLVTKAGYKTGVVRLDLMSDGRKRVQCTLVPATATDGESFCDQRD